MDLERKSRRLVASIVIVAMLAMQVAIAAYRCPYVSGSTAPHSQTSTDCSTASIYDRSTLCAVHGDTQPQLTSGDVVKLPMAPVTFTVLSVTLLIAATVQALSRARSYAASRLAPDGSRPLFIRHQVLLR